MASPFDSLINEEIAVRVRLHVLLDPVPQMMLEDLSHVGGRAVALPYKWLTVLREADPETRSAGHRIPERIVLAGSIVQASM